MLKRKLDEMWERQKVEKENAKLMTKYELEKESSRIISDLTAKVYDLESQLRLKTRDLDLLSDQLDHIRFEVQNESQLNKSVEKVHESHSRVVDERTSHLNEQILKQETELQKLRSQD